MEVVSRVSSVCPLNLGGGESTVLRREEAGEILSATRSTQLLDYLEEDFNNNTSDVRV